MGTGRTRVLSDVTKEAIARVMKRKTARRKRRKAENARLRERGEKFSKKEACYKPPVE
jgi:hypothetical protein